MMPQYFRMGIVLVSMIVFLFPTVSFSQSDPDVSRYYSCTAVGCEQPDPPYGCNTGGGLPQQPYASQFRQTACDLTAEHRCAFSYLYLGNSIIAEGDKYLPPAGNFVEDPPGSGTGSGQAQCEFLYTSSINPGLRESRTLSLIWVEHNCAANQSFDAETNSCPDVPPADKDCRGNSTGGSSGGNGPNTRIKDSDYAIGNPCNPATGNKYQYETDYDPPGLSIRLARHYNSILSSIDLGMGHGWTNNLTTKRIKSIYPLSSTGNEGNNIAHLYSPNGRSEKFFTTGAGWSGEADTKLTMQHTGTAVEIGRRDGRVETYDLDGKLLTEVSASGNTTTFSYNAENQLETVTYPFGHILTLAWDANNHISSITNPHGGSITYEYDANDNLVKVTYPDSTFRLYHYENTNFPHNLTGITDESGNRFSDYAYNSEGKAISTEYAPTSNGTSQERFQLNYED